MSEKIEDPQQSLTRRHSIPISNRRRRLLAPPSECWWIAVLVCKVLVCKMNLLTLWPWHFTFEPQNSRPTTSRISQGHSLHQVWTLWDHSLCCGQTNRQTNKQTDKQTDSKILPTPTDLVDVGKDAIKKSEHTLFRDNYIFSPRLANSWLRHCRWRQHRPRTICTLTFDQPTASCKCDALERRQQKQPVFAGWNWRLCVNCQIITEPQNVGYQISLDLHFYTHYKLRSLYNVEIIRTSFYRATHMHS